MGRGACSIYWSRQLLRRELCGSGAGRNQRGHARADAGYGATDRRADPAGAAPQAPAEPKFEQFLKGFYGTLDVSFGDTTKGINGLTAYSYSLVNPNNPNSGYVQGPAKGTQQVGILGYMPALSTNKSQIGYRNTHKIGDTDTDFMIQVETALSITASPRLKTSYTQQSNVVQGAIGLGDAFLGIQNLWGKLKFGTTYARDPSERRRAIPDSCAVDYTASRRQQSAQASA
jgi:hypothetical protein